VKKSTRRRPEVESLESMMLLSTFVHAEAHTSRPPVVVSSQVTLRGTIHAKGNLTGDTLTIAGSGNLGKVGNASFNLNTSLLAPTSTATLSTRGGRINLVANNGSVFGSNSGTITYTIQGGSGSHASAFGSGTIHVSLTQINGTKVKADLRFTA